MEQIYMTLPKSKMRRLNAGDLIKVAFKEGVHTYARVLVEGSCAFYDCASTVDREDYDSIIASEVLFVTHVFMKTVKEGNWIILINIPLDQDLNAFYPRYFNPAPQNRENVNFYEVYKTEIEDAIEKDWIKTGRIQLDGVAQHFHIEKRIRDYYDRKPNEDNKGIIWFFRKYLGMTTLSYEEFNSADFVHTAF